MTNIQLCKKEDRVERPLRHLDWDVLPLHYPQVVT